MLFKKFRETGPDAIFLIFIVLVLTWTGSFLQPHSPAELYFDIKPMPLFGFLLAFTGLNPLLSVLSAFILVVLISFMLVNFNTSVFFISERTFLPALIYGLLTSFFPQQQVLNPVLPASVFLILAIRRIMDSYKIQGTAFPFYDAGMLISIGSLFYASFVWFGLLLIIGIAILRTWNIKDILISAFGLVTPIFILYGFFYVTGKDMHLMLAAVTYNLFTKVSNFDISQETLAAIIISGFIILISVTHLLRSINAKKIKSRKTFVLLFWIIIIATALFLMFKSVSVEIIWLTAIPASYFLSHYLVFVKRKRIPEILLAILFILSGFVQLLKFMQ
jgi:hypothetical protein